MPEIKKVKLWLVFVAGLIIFDQIIKSAAVRRESIQLNQGVAFGLGQQWFNYWPMVMIALILGLIYKYKLNWQVGLVAAGGIANLIDRLRWGGVIDYISIPNFVSFNLADGLVLAGLLSLMYSFFNGTKNSF